MAVENCISLIGMPGAGKSTLGKILAKTLDYAFVDTDYLLEAAYGMRLQELTDKLPHEAFLDAEAELICALQVRESVIATGGSVIYRPRAMQFLAGLGKIIYLQAPLEAIAARVAINPERGIAFPHGMSLGDIYAERASLYEQYADLNCDTSIHDIESCVNSILAMLEK